MVKRMIVLTVMVGMVAVGCALTLKGAIGVGPWDSLVSTLSQKMGIQFGTFGMAMNFSCIALQVLLLRKEFKKVQYLQILVTIVFGYAINFVLYDLFGSLQANSYVMRMLLLVGGQVICAVAVSAVMLIDMVTFPVEGACMAVSKKINVKFHNVRQGLDVVCVLLVLLLVFVFGAELTVREGTIIAALIFGPMLGIFMKLLKPIFKKQNLIYTEK